MTTTASAQIINLQKINKTYPKGIVALKQINLSLDENEIVGVVGANGSGKSTLLKLMAGNLKPEQGDINIFQLDLHKKAEQVKKQISYISQDRSLDPEMTGKELLYYFAALYGLTGSRARQRYAELINKFQLTDFIERRSNSYSGGQAQRLHLAIGIIHQPKLLLLDEPTSALDPRGKSFFWDFVCAYQQQGNSIIIISHELENIRRYCSRVLLMDKGRLVANETPDAIIQTYATPVLHIKSTCNLSNNQGLYQDLQQAIPSASIEIKAKSVRFEVRQETDFDKSKLLTSVLNVFQKQKCAVMECRWDEPGLESAYYKLTGQNVSSLGNFKNNKKVYRKRR